MSTPKNISVSVKARLQNVAATRGEDFNLLLLRYGIERLLAGVKTSADLVQSGNARVDRDGDNTGRGVLG